MQLVFTGVSYPGLRPGAHPGPNLPKSIILVRDHVHAVEVLSWEDRVPGHQTSMVSSIASPGRETKELTVSLEKHQGMIILGAGNAKRITLAP